MWERLAIATAHTMTHAVITAERMDESPVAANRL